MSSETANGQERVITTTCSGHCGGGACIVKVHVKDGKITRIETDDGEEPQLRACMRGRAYRQCVYSEERLKYPMKRVGVRGEGKFARISWDEALDTVATELKKVYKTYGPASVLLVGGGGDSVSLNTSGLVDRLFCLMGGSTRSWGHFSHEAGIYASLSTYGSMATRNTRDDLLNSRLILMWGWNPANTRTGTNTPWVLAQAKEKGTRIITIDPRYTDSAAVFADAWIPIIPGTDAAMLMAMAYVIIKKNLHDKQFLDKYTIGFDKYKAYLTGTEDGVPKTPAWAEAITGVPAATIEKVALEYATLKPAALMCGISPGRSAFGEQYHRAAIVLAAMTGSIGVQGGTTGGNVWQTIVGGWPFVNLPRGRQGLAGLPNPVEQGAPIRKYALPIYGDNASSARIRRTRVADALIKGKAGGYSADYKFMYILGTAFPNQYADINRSMNAIQTLDFIVTHEQFMSPSARIADILLPATTLYERNDVTAGHGHPPFYGYLHKVIEPLWEARSHFDIITDLARRLGFTEFADKTEENWLREIVKGTSVPDYEEFYRKGYHKIIRPEPYVAFKDQIDDPVKNPFPTPSGKIEIYSRQLEEMHHPHLPPIPRYIETWESRNDPLAKKYPLQLITTHFPRRAHTQFDTVPWLREISPQAISMNTGDALQRNIKTGDSVLVFNDRGQIIMPAFVTERIMPGVVDIPEGAWYAPDKNGVDRGGSPNMLTRDEPSPGGTIATNTALVQVEKVASKN